MAVSGALPLVLELREESQIDSEAGTGERMCCAIWFVNDI